MYSCPYASDNLHSDALLLMLLLLTATGNGTSAITTAATTADITNTRPTTIAVTVECMLKLYTDTLY